MQLAQRLRPPERKAGTGSVRLYLAVAAGSFRRYSTYRAATLAGAFTNTVFGCILAYTFLALWQARPGVGGYDSNQAVTYIWVSQALLITVAVWGGGFQDDVQERFRNGDIAVDLYRPVDFMGWWLAADLGRAAFHLIGRGVAPTLVGVLAFGIRLPGHPYTWAAFLVSVLLAVLVSFGLRFLVSLTGFWLHDSEGVRSVMVVVALFFSGALLPLTLFPGGLGELARLLPWSALIQVPTDVFLERRSGTALLGALGFQAAWAVLLLAAGRLVQLLATRKVVVHGG
ncbi:MULTISPECIES: ABC-2 family transporter protein [unclassified Kitasatospora]|uniref:ABC transporter permease n=1 Tax=unclassified Kitasatospora TaxID=2633591 RepID=UPI00070BC538|nr:MULTISPECIES: ABC-2 family transporter protein [unclassified Kitasatospora]KQV11731.1 ABC transporter permease [Kitasatospora sp. Root107]KRB76687.1 ABC transporter permease [Kitasatospora sp. Root187]